MEETAPEPPGARRPATPEALPFRQGHPATLVTKRIIPTLTIPTADLLVSTLLLLQRPETQGPSLLRLSGRRAVAWNTTVGSATRLVAVHQAGH